MDNAFEFVLLNGAPAFIYLAFNPNTTMAALPKPSFLVTWARVDRQKGTYNTSLIMSITTSYLKTKQVYSNSRLTSFKVYETGVEDLQINLSTRCTEPIKQSKDCWKTGVPRVKTGVRFRENVQWHYILMSNLIEKSPFGELLAPQISNISI